MPYKINEVPSNEELCQLLLDFHRQTPEPVCRKPRMNSMDTLTQIATEKLAKYEKSSSSPSNHMHPSTKDHSYPISMDGNNSSLHIPTKDMNMYMDTSTQGEPEQHSGDGVTKSERETQAPMKLSENAAIFFANRMSGRGGISSSSSIVPSVRIAGCKKTDDTKNCTGSNTSGRDRSSEAQDSSDNPPRIGAYTYEERAYIIERYMLKRSRARSYGRIRYHCRKNLADSRVRVKGRFVTAEVAAEIAASVAMAVKGSNVPIGHGSGYRLQSNTPSPSISALHSEGNALVPMAVIHNETWRPSDSTNRSIQTPIHSYRNPQYSPAYGPYGMFSNTTEPLITPPYGAQTNGAQSPMCSSPVPAGNMTPLGESLNASKKALPGTYSFQDYTNDHHYDHYYDQTLSTSSTLLNMIAGESRSGRKRTLSSNFAQY